VLLARTDVSEQLIASMIRVQGVSELGTSLAIVFNYRWCSKLPDSPHRDDGGAMFLRNVRSYKTHTASHSRRRHSSNFPFIGSLLNPNLTIRYYRIVVVTALVRLDC
jgi:hypothetical protein